MPAPARTADEVVSRLRPLAGPIRALGVRRLALFGSLARDQARADSDADLLVDFVPGEKSLDRFLALADLLEQSLGRPVELVTREGLSPHLAPAILRTTRDVMG